jgi:hypothetical protein
MVVQHTTPARWGWERATLTVDVGRRKNVRELASFLGLDAKVIAEGLIDAVERDLALKRFAAVLHAA